MFNAEEKERYSRQILLDSFGEEGQLKLNKASVLVIGAGGLGCPALTYLAAAGIGHIGIMDHDIVELSNLHRQTLYSTSDIGKKKVTVAAEKLLSINPDLKISTFDFSLDPANALEIIRDYDIVIDGTDNLHARYIVNDACALLCKAWVYGSVYKFEGQVALFNFVLSNGARSADYRSLFPEPPPASSVASCNESGVIGVVPALIGILQATECIKYLSIQSSENTGKLFCYNALSLSFENFEISRNAVADANRPNSFEAFRKMNYEEYCIGKADARYEIEPQELISLLVDQELEIFDIRESDELSPLKGIDAKHLPYSSLDILQFDHKEGRPLVFICQRGIRSKKLIDKLRAKNIKGVFYSLKQGAEGWTIMKQEHNIEQEIR